AAQFLGGTGSTHAVKLTLTEKTVKAALTVKRCGRFWSHAHTRPKGLVTVPPCPSPLPPLRDLGRTAPRYTPCRCRGALPGAAAACPGACSLPGLLQRP